MIKIRLVDFSDGQSTNSSPNSTSNTTSVPDIKEEYTSTNTDDGSLSNTDTKTTVVETKETKEISNSNSNSNNNTEEIKNVSSISGFIIKINQLVILISYIFMFLCFSV